MKKNNILKIFISVMLAAMLCFGACGCGNSTTNAAAAKETAKSAKEDSATKETTTASKDKKTTTSKSEKETTTQASRAYEIISVKLNK